MKQNVKPVNVTSTDVKRESVTGRVANTGSLNEGYVRPNVIHLCSMLHVLM